MSMTIDTVLAGPLSSAAQCVVNFVFKLGFETTIHRFLRQ